MKYDRVETEHFIATLRVLMDRGAEIARSLVADAEKPGADLSELAEKYERVSGAVRRTILLSDRLAERLELQEAEAKRVAAGKPQRARSVVLKFPKSKTGPSYH